MTNDYVDMLRLFYKIVCAYVCVRDVCTTVCGCLCVCVCVCVVNKEERISYDTKTWGNTEKRERQIERKPKLTYFLVDVENFVYMLS